MLINKNRTCSIIVNHGSPSKKTSHISKIGDTMKMMESDKKMALLIKKKIKIKRNYHINFNLINHTRIKQ